MNRSSSNSCTRVRLRSVELTDLGLLYEYQLDPESNQMACTHPRTSEDFDAHWGKSLSDPSIVVKAIIADQSLAGCITCFECDNQHHVGYWVGRDFWGQGIATRALKLLLDELPIRPLHSRVAVRNIASIRVLQKCGFREVCREWSPATKRYLECEEVLMRLTD